MDPARGEASEARKLEQARQAIELWWYLYRYLMLWAQSQIVGYEWARPDGKCVGWANIGSICGSPPTTHCTSEIPNAGAENCAAVAAVWQRAEAVEHGLFPSRLALGGRRQLENCAILVGVANRTAMRCAVKRAVIVGDQAREGEGAVAGATSKTVEHSFDRRGLGPARNAESNKG